MNLERAIQLLQGLSSSFTYEDLPSTVDACKLGIEALKRVSFSRRDPNRPSEPPLLGETED